MDIKEIAIGMKLYFQREYDVEGGTVIGFTDTGDVILDVMGMETIVDPYSLAEDPADAW